MNVRVSPAGIGAPSPVASATPSFEIKSPTGADILIPADVDEDFAYFTPDQGPEIRQYYEENGYVVVRNLVPREACDAARAKFEQEVKPSGRFIYRQTTANPERHTFTPEGFMLNPILNIQSLDPRHFGGFIDASTAIMTRPAVQAVLREILGEPPKLVQSMYFEGNSATWAHQDTYYLDAEEIGGMTAAWYAMEDIAPGAGRFFVYPKSHLVDMAKNGGDFDIAFHHGRYKRLVIDVIRRHGLECRAPALRQGDALFWSAKTIHGSLPTKQPERSRSSITTHYIPDSSRFLQFQARFRGLSLHPIGGMRVHKPKDLSRPSRRTVMWVETTFPKSFQSAKKLAIKAFTR
jgi:phytanoyl-CoA hydroxylase